MPSAEYNYLKDIERIKIQADFLYAFDLKVLHRAITLLQKENPERTIKILDIGCGDGYLTYSRFQNFSGIEVLGLDKNDECISSANYRNEENFKFLVRNVETEEIKELGTFDIVFSAHTVHHFSFPQMVLQKLWERIGSNGYLIIRTFDDSSKTFYPKSNILNKLISEYKFFSKSDRNYGNRLYGDLCCLNPKPKKIKMHFKVECSVDKSIKGRQLFFEDLFQFRIQNMTDRNLLSEKDYLEIDLLKQEFIRNKIFFVAPQYLAITQKNNNEKD